MFRACNKMFRQKKQLLAITDRVAGAQAGGGYRWQKVGKFWRIAATCQELGNES